MTPFDKAVAQAKRAVTLAEKGVNTPAWPKLLAAAEKAVAKARALR